jgi:hypothetical protein
VRAAVRRGFCEYVADGRGTVRRMRSILVLLTISLTALGGCSKDQPGPAGPGPGGGEQNCTALGCINGLRVSLEKATPWAAGNYTFAFDLDGTAVTCKGALPLKACDAGPSLTCDVADKVQVGESGCAMGPETHGFSDVQIGSSPRAVALKISREDQVMHEAKLAPTYATSRPNGEACEPVCNSASERVALP